MIRSTYGFCQGDLGPNEVEVVPPAGPDPRDQNPEGPIPVGETRSLAPSFQDPHLVLEDEDSEGHCPAGSKGIEQGEGEGLEDEGHAGKMGKGSWKVQRGKADGVIGKGRHLSLRFAP